MNVHACTVELIQCIKDASSEAVPEKKSKLQGPRVVAPPEVLTLIKNSSRAFQDWDEEGRPPSGAQSHSVMRSEKRKVRKALRKIETCKTQNFCSKLMSNPGSKEFH